MPVNNDTRVPTRSPTSTETTASTPVRAPATTAGAPPVDGTSASARPPPELPAPLPAEGDNYQKNFRPERTTSQTIAIRGQELPFAKAVEVLVPDTGKFEDLAEVVARYSGDFAVLADQLIGVRNLTPEQKADRLFQFFLKYGERFVELVQATQNPQPGQGQGQSGSASEKGGKLPTPELKAFLTALTETGFGELKDQRTEKPALQVARELLGSRSVPEFEQRAAATVLVPNQPTPPSQAPAPGQPFEAQSAPGRPETFAAAAERAAASVGAVDARQAERALPDRMKVNAWGPESAFPVVQPKSQSDASSEDEAWTRHGTTNKRLGLNMLWNVLHRSRDNPEDSALAQEKWDRVTFGAMLALIGIALLVIVLVNL